MAARVIHKKFRGYSGPVVYGEKLGDPTFSDEHIERVVLLTEAVETGRRAGSVFAADGTAMTGGRAQHILVYPRELANEDWNAKNDQGGLGSLLRLLEVEVGGEPVNALFRAFEIEGWYLAQDGQLRWLKSGRIKVANRWVDYSGGDVVYGAVLRDAITPKGGKVPSSGPEWETAKQWALLFHEVFQGDKSMEAQQRFEVMHLVDRIGTRKYQFFNNRRSATVAQVVYGPGDPSTLRVGRDISAHLDLAMCLFHSHSVNAPSVAFASLRDALRATGFTPADRGLAGEVSFARELLRRLANTSYGRWNDSIEGGRWNRSRKRAMEFGFWPEAFFRQGNDGIMLLRMP